MYNPKEDLKQFFYLLNIVEESDNGREFRPNYISSCRVMDSARLGEILQRLEEYAKTPDEVPNEG